MIIDLITGSSTTIGEGNQTYNTEIEYENQDVQTKLFIQNKLLFMSGNPETYSMLVTNENDTETQHLRRLSTKFDDVLSDGTLRYLVTREYNRPITDKNYYSVKKFVYTLTKTA